VVFGHAGENSKEHLHKGSRILIDGRLAQRRWETAGGQKRSKYEVVANTVQFIDAMGPAAPGQDEDLSLQ
jgi:single-strand DNA-binding protein